MTDWKSKLGKKQDMTGMSFGRLTVESVYEIKSYSNSRSVIWTCRCECGGVSNVSENNLRSKHTASCGCLSSEKAKLRFRDRTGDKVGRLTVVKRLENRNKRSLWLCECECGNSVEVFGDNLGGNNTFSCGCFMVHQVSGENSKSWKGGRWLGTDGYVHVNVGAGERPEREHRIVGGKALGRELRTNEVVHHIDGDKSNNNNDNLLICTSSYHSALHQKMRRARA